MTTSPRRLRVALGALAVLVLLLALAALLLWNLNWARPLVIEHLQGRSQREVRIDDLQVRLDRHWQPVVALRGLRIANADWAGPEPFIDAREASFTFEWTSLFADVRIVREMRLVGARVSLHRQADGLRNWRLTRPDDRGPGRMRILRLAAEDSRLDLVHEGVELQVSLSAQAPPVHEDGYERRITFQGRFHGAAFEGHADTAASISMFGTGEFFPLRGEVRSSDASLQAEGRVADLLRLEQLDAHVRLHGDTLAALKAFIPGTPWPHSKPYRFEGDLAKRGDTWSARRAQLRIARTDLGGDATFALRPDGRHELKGQVRSRALHVEDLPLEPGDKPRAAPVAKPAMRLLPQSPVKLDGLRRLDGRIELQVDALHAPDWPVASGVRATLALDHGKLDVRLREGDLAGGALKGEFTLDAHDDSPTATLDLRAQGLALDRLWPRLPKQPGLEWPALQGHVRLQGQGASVADWLGKADGRVDLALKGGSVSRKLDARLGLDAGRMLSTLVRKGDEAVPIRCGAVSLAFANGTGRTQSFVLDTDRTQVEGQGSVHLGDETWALLLTPKPRDAALALPSSILAQGTFRGLHYSLKPREELPASARRTCG